MLTQEILSLHDNSRPYTLQLRPKLYITFLAEKFWTPPPLFPTAPDLAASDFQVFCYLKHLLGSNHYNEDENSCELLVIGATGKCL